MSDPEHDELAEKFPFISQEPLESLEAIYPERSADPEWTDRQVWINSGECRVVRFLRQIHTDQNLE